MKSRELLKKIKSKIQRDYGRRCKGFDYNCTVCQVWMAYSILFDHFTLDTWKAVQPKKWYQFWK